MLPEFDVPISASETIRNITVRVRFKGAKLASWRLNVAASIIRFAVWIGGFGGIKFEDSDT